MRWSKRRRLEMNSNPRPPDYNPPNTQSRLEFYEPCQTPISGEMWLRHLRTIETLENQATKLGLIAVAFELDILRAEHVAGQLRYELGGKQ